MRLKLFLPILLIIVLMGCSPVSTPTEAPATDTRIPPTLTLVPPTASRTPEPSATVIPSPTEILPGAVLFEEDFEDGTADNFIYIADRWVVSTEDNGNKVFEINTNTEEAINNDEGGGIGFGSEDWTNYSAEYRVKMLNWKANTWLSFRSTIGDNETYYVEWLSAEYDTFSLHINLNYGPWDSLKFLEFPVRVERWYRVRVEAQGPELRVYLDDTLMIQVEDSRIGSGGFNLGVMSGTHALFDDIRVVALGALP